MLVCFSYDMVPQEPRTHSPREMSGYKPHSYPRHPSRRVQNISSPFFLILRLVVVLRVLGTFYCASYHQNIIDPPTSRRPPDCPAYGPLIRSQWLHGTLHTPQSPWTSFRAGAASTRFCPGNLFRIIRPPRSLVTPYPRTDGLILLK